MALGAQRGSGGKAGQHRAGRGCPGRGADSCAAQAPPRGGVGSEGSPARLPVPTLPRPGLEPGSQEDLALGLVARIQHGHA